MPHTTSSPHDVTGGIHEKIKVNSFLKTCVYALFENNILVDWHFLNQVAVEIAKLGIDVFIVKAGTIHSEAALRGQKPLVGTLVTSIREEK